MKIVSDMKTFQRFLSLNCDENKDYLDRKTTGCDHFRCASFGSFCYIFWLYQFVPCNKQLNNRKWGHYLKISNLSLPYWARYRSVS